MRKYKKRKSVENKEAKAKEAKRAHLEVFMDTTEGNQGEIL